MNNTSAILEETIFTFMKAMAEISKETRAILRFNSATPAATLVEALASGDSPATVSTKLTKDQYKNMVGALIQIDNFFLNQAVQQGDYLNSIENVTNGSASLQSPLSQQVESVGERLKSIALNLRHQYAEAVETVKVYNISELGTALGGLSDHVVVFGCDTTKSKFLAGIVFMEQFAKLLSNQAVAQSDYQATIARWTTGV